jgi:hypothetical protein
MEMDEAMQLRYGMVAEEKTYNIKKYIKGTVVKNIQY